MLYAISYLLCGIMVCITGDSIVTAFIFVTAFLSIFVGVALLKIWFDSLD